MRGRAHSHSEMRDLEVQAEERACAKSLRQEPGQEYSGFAKRPQRAGAEYARREPRQVTSEDLGRDELAPALRSGMCRRFLSEGVILLDFGLNRITMAAVSRTEHGGKARGRERCQGWWLGPSGSGRDGRVSSLCASGITE